jgi:Transcriptional regulators
MNSIDFPGQFESMFRQIYGLAARRLKNAHENLTVETIALLEHLAVTGPVTVGELTRHLDRAASTISEMIEPLIVKGLVERERDPADGRRSLLWLTPEGQAARVRAQSVLDNACLQLAADQLSAQDRALLLELLEKFVRHLSMRRGLHER